MCENKKEVHLGKLFVLEFIKAAAWGIVFLLVVSMLIVSLKDEIKQGIAFGVDRFVTDAVLLSDNPEIAAKIKAVLKDSIEYSVKKAVNEAQSIMSDTSVEIKFNQKPKVQKQPAAETGVPR